MVYGGLDSYGYSVAKQNGEFDILTRCQNYEKRSIYAPLTFTALVQAGSGIFIYSQDGEKWGAINPNVSDLPEVKAEWDGIWRDGYGGYTVMKKQDDGSELYGIVDKNGAIVSDLSAMPIRRDGDFLSKETHDLFPWVEMKLRIIERNGKYGLVKDGEDGEGRSNTIGSELLHEPFLTWHGVIQTGFGAKSPKLLRNR